LNLRPSASEADALSTELQAQLLSSAFSVIRSEKNS
jgi:hypothetical protein